MAEYRILLEHAARFGITRREQEKLALLAGGSSTADIQARLSVSKSTVRGHISSVSAKIGARGRAHLTARAIEEGVLVKAAHQPRS